jgi:hypothetical protein
MASVIIRPISTLVPSPDYQHWANSRVPSGTLSDKTWSLVDEAEADDDTTYFQCATTNRSFEHFGMSDPKISAGTITNVRVYFRCRHATATGYSRAIVGGVGGSVGETKTSTTSYQTFYEDFANNPVTSSAWKWSDFYGESAYNFGIEGWGNGTKANNRCTQFYVEITYNVPPAGIKVDGVTATKINGVTPAKINGVS